MGQSSSKSSSVTGVSGAPPAGRDDFRGRLRVTPEIRERLEEIQTRYRQRCEEENVRVHKGVQAWMDACMEGTTDYRRGDLRYCRFRDAQKLSLFLETLSHYSAEIVGLHLTNSVTSPEICDVVAKYMDVCKGTLKHVRLEDNRGFGSGEEGLKKIFTSLIDCKSLESIRLPINFQSNDLRANMVFSVVADMISENPGIMYINLGLLPSTQYSTSTKPTEPEAETEINTSSGIGYLLKTLESNNSVRKVSLKSACLGAKYGESIANVLALNGTITVLNLSRNQLGSEGILSLSAGLRDNDTLYALNVYGNFAGDLEIAKLLAVVREKRNIRVVDVGMNDLMTESISVMAAILLQPDCVLEKVGFAYGSFQGKDVHPITHALKSNVSMRHIDLSYNDLFDIGLKPFTAILAGNRSLRHIHLQGNTVSESAAMELLNPIKEAVNVHTFQMIAKGDTIVPRVCIEIEKICAQRRKQSFASSAPLSLSSAPVIPSHTPFPNAVTVREKSRTGRDGGSRAAFPV